MYNREIKIVAAVLLFAFMVYQFVLVNIGWGIILLLITALVVLTIFRHEGIVMALYHFRKNDLEKAGNWLNKVKAPHKLIKTQEAYYYYLQGLLSMQSKSIAGSEKLFKKALNLGLRMKEDQAVAKLNLAGISLSKRRKRDAIQYLDQAKKLDERKMLADQIKMLRSQLGRI